MATPSTASDDDESMLASAGRGRRKKRLVLHVINGLGSGGAEALLFRIATRKSDLFDHEIVVLLSRGWYSGLLEKLGVKVHHLGMKSRLSGIPMTGRLNRLIRKIDPDIVHGWMYGSNLVAGLVAKRSGIPVVWGIHSSTLEGLSMVTRVAARVGGLFSSRLADRVVNCSTRSAELHSQIGYSRSVTVVPNGYDENAFHPDEKLRAEARRALGIDPGTYLVGSIARWNVRKDVPNLLDALRLLNARMLPMHTLLIGQDLDASNPALANALESRCSGNSVSLLGHRSDLEMLARAIDLHVLPSATEAFPNVVAETMLSGTPNVVTDVGDAALIVGDSGWVVPPHDPAGLAAAIEAACGEWQDNPGDWQKRRARARALVVERFTFERMAQGYEKVWLEVIEAAQRSPLPRATQAASQVRR
jgi:glycosyltransferase involved in cell wall biosynthesis